MCAPKKEEEKIIEGVLHHKVGEEFVPYTIEELSAKVAAQVEVAPAPRPGNGDGPRSWD